MALSSYPLARALSAAVSARRQWQMLLFVLIGVVFYLAVTPAPPKTIDLGWDKLNHLVAFAALTFAGRLGFPGERRVVWAVLLGMLALGGLIEIAQYFVPGRSCEWLDLGADALGIVCGGASAQLAQALARRVGSAAD